MNAGKSLQLLAVQHGYEERGLHAEVYTAELDDRYGVGRITSRVGISTDAKVFNKETVFSNDMLPPGTACLLIDESQFLSPGQVRQLHRMASVEGGTPVMAFGLRTDFQGVPFPGAAMLMCLAEELDEIRALCRCGKRATMNVRLAADGSRVREGEQVQIGGNSRYEAVCARCFYAGLPG